MNALESLRAGDLAAALQQVTDAARNDPAASKHRIFLFQLLAISGQWDRALNQLKVLEDLDAATLPMVQTYREALQCEAFRHAVFQGQQTPHILGEPPEWVGLLVEAVRSVGQGQFAAGAKLRDHAFELAPAVGGTLNGEPFAWVADADNRFGPVLEAIINGRYYWVPLERVAQLTVDEPTDLRDMVWIPAHFRWTNGGETVALLPVRYPGSATDDDDAVKLARKTLWQEQPEGWYFGRGQRLLTTDTAEVPLLEVRELTMQPPPEASTDA